MLKRNRHTGRVNSAKKIVLDRGVSFKDSRGVEYVSLDKSTPIKKGEEIIGMIRKCQIVKKPA